MTDVADHPEMTNLERVGGWKESKNMSNELKASKRTQNSPK